MHAPKFQCRVRQCQRARASWESWEIAGHAELCRASESESSSSGLRSDLHLELIHFRGILHSVTCPSRVAIGCSVLKSPLHPLDRGPGCERRVVVVDSDAISRPEGVRTSSSSECVITEHQGCMSESLSIGPNKKVSSILLTSSHKC